MSDVVAFTPVEGDGYLLRLTFGDGTVKVIDLEPLFYPGDPRYDLTVFRSAVVDRESGTLVWPDGVDVAPDVLYDDNLYPADWEDEPGVTREALLARKRAMVRETVRPVTV
ncbi:MAG: DUF2442 domain-containing protein [Chloroflexota bacterium]